MGWESCKNKNIIKSEWGVERDVKIKAEKQKVSEWLREM